MYYTHAFYEEGPYFQWTEQENRLMNRSSDAPKQLASVYFYTASIVWGLPPLLMGFAIILMAFYDLKVFGRSISRWVFLFFPLVAGGIAIATYVIMPIIAVIIGVKIVIFGGRQRSEAKASSERTRDKMDEKPFRQGSFLADTKDKVIPIFKLFENTAEALPQFILAATFYSNNTDFVSQQETVFGITVPVTLVSMVFSVGSILHGIYKLWFIYVISIISVL